MSRYVDVERMPSGPNWDALDDKEKATVLSFLIQLPTADVKEVRHGHWKMCYYPNDEHVECSECHAQYYEYDLYLGGNEFPKRCPECGAHMDVKEEEE